MSTESGPASPRGAFPPTQWTLIIEAAHAEDPDAVRRALENFCLQYVEAIRIFLMRRGCSQVDAEDLTQEFLYSDVLKDWDQADTIIHRARRQSGHRFRSFLSSALIFFLTDRHRATNAAKRGGGRVVSLDEVVETGVQVGQEPAAEWARQFDLDYARAILRRATQSLRHCDQNLALLTRSKTQSEVATELGMTENAVKQMHHQFRQRLGAAIRAEVERTVGPDPGELEGELRYLLSLFGDLS
ncbi:MAG: hypothetical protein IT581_13865 [Verrucomicrobiales bacterium]|nr:hypothetical protein [Verrucomicrobiales bacterium]